MSINISQALSSESYAKKCWINYYYQNNSMGITDGQMGEIAGVWKDYLGSWKTYAESDHTRYDIDDSDYEDAVAAGRADAKSYNKGSKGWQITRTSVDGVVAVGGNTVGKKYGRKWIQDEHIENVNNKKANIETNYKQKSEDLLKAKDEKMSNLDSTGENYLDESNNIENEYLEGQENLDKQHKADTDAAKKSEQWDVGLLIACAFDVATAAMYRISKPNKKQKDAIDSYAENMGELQQTTCTTQDDLATMDSELIEYSDNAVTATEGANTSIADARTLYQFHADTIEYFEKAKTSGYELTQDDVDLYMESVQYMAELSEEVGTTQEEAETTVQDIYDNMNEYQDGFDTAAENIGNVEGFTEEASKVDESTQVQCYIEGASQGINALGAAKDGYEAITFGTGSSVATFGASAAYIVAGGLAVAAGISDGFASAEQFKWASETGDEIKAREATQDLNAGTLEIYNENNDYYQGYMENVEGLSVVRPDDMTVPEGDIPGVTPDDDGDKGDDPNKKKK